MLGKVFNRICHRLPTKFDLQGRSIWRVSTIFSKWSLNASAKSLSAVITLSSSTRTIFSSLRILSVKLGLTVFQKRLLSVSFSRWDYHRNLFLILRSLLDADWFSAQLNFLSLLKRRVCVMIALRSCLFINTVWLHLAYFSFSGAWEFNSFEVIKLNSSNPLVWTFWKDNSRKRSLLKCS